MPGRLTSRQRRLLAWADGQARDLPWRHTRDPWAILVSEVMLQQTQVARVVPVWTAFLAQFPTATACANAPQAAVVTAWHGMGYNRRALNLHRCAIAVRDNHGGALPNDLAQLMALPGLGPYTARAVLVFAFEEPVGVVDVNAARVLARWAGESLDAKQTQRQADAAVPTEQPWRWNQTMLDLGATICTKRNPKCVECPVSTECAWHGDGPDPAVHPPRQSPFVGSDRQGRGRLVAALRQGPVSDRPEILADVMGWPNDPERARRVADSLVNDGLAKWEQLSGSFCLQ